jgi:CBS domain containing-hemolysin-like protein
MIGAKEGSINSHEKKMIDNIFELNDTTVEEIMTPRTDMYAVNANLIIKSVIDDVLKEGYTRVPVYEKTTANITGIIHVAQLFDCVNKNKVTKKIKTIKNQVRYVPETKKIDELIREFQKNKEQMAIVIDEFGGTAGLLTLEDLIEEIVGEIHDEHEAPELDEIIPQQNGAHLVDGKVLLEDFNELFGVQLEEEDIDTIGGYIFNREGHIPEVGETCEVGERTVEIVHADERRIYKLLVHPEEEKTNTPVSDA